MRDLDRDPYTTEERALRRALIEDHGLTVEEHDEESEVDLDPYMVYDRRTLAKVAALEAEDTANPIAATAVVRPDLDLVLDEAAVLAKFPQEENRG